MFLSSGQWVMSSRDVAPQRTIETLYFMSPEYQDLEDEPFAARLHCVGVKTHGRCWYCAVQATTVDHLVPRIRGGGDDFYNLLPACRSCNSTKGTRPFGVFRALAAKGVVVPIGFVPLFYGEWYHWKGRVQ